LLRNDKVQLRLTLKSRSCVG